MPAVQPLEPPAPGRHPVSGGQPPGDGAIWYATIFALPFLLLAACAGEGPKDYIQPASPDAETKACLEYCQGQRFDCRNRALKEHRSCEAEFEYRYREWQRCSRTRSTRACASLKPFACPSPNYTPCTRDFDQCFLGCGGTIDRGP